MGCSRLRNLWQEGCRTARGTSGRSTARRSSLCASSVTDSLVRCGKVSGTTPPQSLSKLSNLVSPVHQHTEQILKWSFRMKKWSCVCSGSNLKIQSQNWYYNDLLVKYLPSQYDASVLLSCQNLYVSPYYVIFYKFTP